MSWSCAFGADCAFPREPLPREDKISADGHLVCVRALAHARTHTLGAPLGNGVDDGARGQVEGDFAEEEGKLGAAEQDDAPEV
jgi:hypothetical protein